MIKSAIFFENASLLDPFSMNEVDRAKFQIKYLIALTEYHKSNCPQYSKILDFMNIDIAKINSNFDLPFIPTRLFKLFNLTTGENSSSEKNMTSSGTSGQQLSSVSLSKENMRNQTRVLSSILSSFIGKKRLPMLVIDTQDTLSKRDGFSARTAGILGFSIFATDRVFALNNDFSINYEVVSDFLNKYGKEPYLVFGFTFIVWKHFYQAHLVGQKTLDLSNGILFHGGGWKKLTEMTGVRSKEFRIAIHNAFHLRSIHDYYGMVEQAGSIFVECEAGYLHSSIYSDLIIRSDQTLEVLPVGSRGLVQVVSLIPESYPGHSLITEDEGKIIGIDDCECGRLGKYFEVFGRLKNAELRGCSDTYASQLR
jgi:phenylacetate-coenzyme A ligase PaaK-like adenylate-forming protein